MICYVYTSIYMVVVIYIHTYINNMYIPDLN